MADERRVGIISELRMGHTLMIENLASLSAAIVTDLEAEGLVNINRYNVNDRAVWAVHWKGLEHGS